MRLIPYVVCASLFAVPVSAQLVVTGKVLQNSGPCVSFASHAIECTPLQLTTSNPAINLASFENQVVEVTGTVSFPCGSVMDVQSISASSAFTVLSAPGGTGLGQMLTFTTTTPAGSYVSYLFGDPGFLPMGESGTFFLSILFLVDLGWNISATGTDVVSVPIPNDVTLVGLTGHYQFVSTTLSNGVVSSQVLNPICVTVTL